MSTHIGTRQDFPPMRGHNPLDAFTKGVNGEWKIVNQGIDQVKICIDEQLEERKRIAWKGLRLVSKPEGVKLRPGWLRREYAGPEMKGIQIRFRECWEVNGDMQFSYFLVTMQPHSLLDETVKLANGHEIIEMLVITSEILSSYLFPVTLQELLASRIHYLEIAFDIIGISTNNLDRYPYRRTKRERLSEVFEDDIQKYYGIKNRSGATVSYNKDTLNIVDKRYLRRYNVTRLEYRYYCRSINRILDLDNSQERNLHRYISSDNLDNLLLKSIQWRTNVFPGVILISEGMALIKINWFRPKSRERLINALHLRREDAKENKSDKIEYNTLRKYMRKKGMVISSSSEHPMRIHGFFEALSDSIMEIQRMNKRAVKELFKLASM